jgi:clusterin-associated protein 1
VEKNRRSKNGSTAASAIRQGVEPSPIESTLSASLSALVTLQVEDHIRSLEHQLDELERNEKTLDSKIEKKKAELERNEKRLSTLQSVRPAYMDEYERLQAELNVLYGQYLDRYVWH